MESTLEMRWFESGSPPAELRDWFEDLGRPSSNTRTDLYLPCGDPARNLKLRNGRIEVKQRLAGPIRRSFGPAVTGDCEQWTKWSFPLRETPTPLTDDPTDLWVPVEKTRTRHAFEATEQTDLSGELPASPPATVLVELTEVTAGSATAWTFCLETAGPSSGLVETLTAAGSTLLTDGFPTTLSADRSFGYVRWLQGLPTVTDEPAPEVRIPPAE